MSDAPVLEVRGLRKEFVVNGGLLRRGGRLLAIDDVSFDLAAGETVALVGESGSGKSTTGQVLIGLLRPDGGTVRVVGTDITQLRRKDLRRVRRHVQMIWQDPYSSLDPSRTIADSIAEPLVVHTNMTRRERHKRVAELLDDVGLPTGSSVLDRYPHEFSGGQRQRIAIARALALGPEVIVCDEAVSALDVSTQAQVLNLLRDLQVRRGMAYLFISHDLSVVRQVSDRVAVMYLGRIVEQGPVHDVYEDPQHPYTRMLLSSVPSGVPRRDRRGATSVSRGEPPDPLNPPAGCAFRPRCDVALDEICTTTRPALTESGGGRIVACHLHATPVADPYVAERSRLAADVAEPANPRRSPGSQRIPAKP